ncbi:MAG: hypothetical protein AB7P69_04645 [Candidatus Binatia bacterium]
MRIQRFLHFLLFLIVILLLWRIAEAWRRPLEEYRTTTRQGPTEEKPLPPSQVTSPQIGKRFARIIADKDLFVPSRSRAQEEVKSPVATIPPPSHLKLVGVVLTRGKEEAFFADATQGGKVVRLRKGESLGSYKLVSVAPLQATLTMGQDEGEEISLPLLVLDSSTAGQAQHFLAQLRGNQGRSSQAVRQATGRPDVAAGENAPQTESHALRQNIQQLQQRLRQIRRQAARNGGNEEAASDEEEDVSNEEEEE